MLKIDYQLQGRSLQTNLSWRYSEILNGGKKRYRGLRIATGVKCNAEDFDLETKQPQKEARRAVYSFEELVVGTFKELQHEGGRVTPKRLKSEIGRKNGKSTSTNEVWSLADFTRLEMIKEKREHSTGICLFGEYQAYFDNDQQTELSRFIDFWKTHGIRCKPSKVAVFSAPVVAEVLAHYPRFEMLSRIIMEEELSMCQEIPQYHIATFLGVSPETLSRIKKRAVTK